MTPSINPLAGSHVYNNSHLLNGNAYPNGSQACAVPPPCRSKTTRRVAKYIGSLGAIVATGLYVTSRCVTKHDDAKMLGGFVPLFKHALRSLPTLSQEQTNPRIEPLPMVGTETIPLDPIGILFPWGKPKAKDIIQLQHADCFFVSPLASWADLPGSDLVIRKAIQAVYTDGALSYNVSLFNQNRKRVYLEVSALAHHAIDVSSNDLFHGGNWATIMEKAFIKLLDLDSHQNTRLGYNSVAQGGEPSEAIRALVGNATSTLDTKTTDQPALWTQLALSLAQHQIIVGSTPDETSVLKSGIILEQRHTYSLLSLDTYKETINVRNPWGFNYIENSEEKVDATFDMTKNEFLNSFSTLDFSLQDISHHRHGISSAFSHKIRTDKQDTDMPPLLS